MLIFKHMIIISNYFAAIFFCVLAMICWGSWANTQKLAAKNWRFEMFYWDKVAGILLMSLLAAFTIGSLGDEGRTFIDDIQQADSSSIFYAILGGVLWNAGNLLLVAAIAYAGMSVAFPVGGGIAWIVGIVFNYFVVLLEGKIPSNKPVILWIGVVVIILAIFLSSKAYSRLAKEQNKTSAKGLALSVIAGLFIAFFYGFVVKSLDPAFVDGGSGKLAPSSAIFFFALGVIPCTAIFYLFVLKPLKIGDPGSFKEFFKGNFKTHAAGILGGMIWCLGMVTSFLAVGAANPAIAYALSNAAPVVAILWGVFVWKEFSKAPKGTNILLIIMFIGYLIGLSLITYSNA